MDKKKEKEIREQRDNSISKFVSTLSFIVNAVYEKNRRDPDIDEIRNQYSIAKNIQPDGLVLTVGPYLWIYKDMIYNENVDFFLKADMKSEIEKHGQIQMGEDVPVQIQKLKEVWSLFSDSEKKNLIKRLKNLIVYYSSFLQAEKLMNQFNIN